MKKLRFPVSVLRLAMCAVLVVSASQSVNAHESKSGAIFATSAAGGGRLIIRRSPTLGHNMAVSLTIDGQLAGTISRGRTYDRYLTPGRHVLIASPNRLRGEWQGILDVRRGETYSYTVSYSKKLVLTPESASH
jgi:hypothetical protein